MEKINDLIQMFRDKVPEIAIRTTLIVGYPGETNEDYELLLLGRSSLYTLYLQQCKDYCQSQSRQGSLCQDNIIDLCYNVQYETENWDDLLDIEKEYCGCFLDDSEYEAWYTDVIDGNGLTPEDNIVVANPACIYGECIKNTSYKFDGYDNCDPVTFCINNVDVGGDLIMTDDANLTLLNDCGSGVEDNDVDADELLALGNKSLIDQFMALDFLGEYTPYIIIAVFIIMIIAYIYTYYSKINYFIFRKHK